jgi:hypothetical protein
VAKARHRHAANAHLRQCLEGAWSVAARAHAGRGKTGRHGGFNAPTSIDVSQIVGHEQFMRNPARWVHDVLTPLLEQKFGKFTSDEIGQAVGSEDWKVKDWDDLKRNMPNREALEAATSFIGRMFGDRNAMNSIIEMQQMFPKLTKDADQMLEMIRRYQEYGTWYREGSLDYQMQTFGEQLKNIMQLFGSAQSGPAVAAMAKFSQFLQMIVGFIGKLDPGQLSVVGQGLTALAAGLAALAVVQIATLIGIPALIGGVVAALGTLVAVNWGSITSGLSSLASVLAGLPGAIWGAVKGLLGIGGGGGGAPGVGPEGFTGFGVLQRHIKRRQHGKETA